MASVPPPPIKGPLTIPPSAAAPPGYSLLHIWRWNATANVWEFIQWLETAWDAWPAGYYVTSHLAIDGNVDWGPHSQVIQVVSRTRPDGTAAPYVLDPPPAGAGQSPDCPSGFYLTDIGSKFGEPGLMCALFSSATVPACPPGTVWDPVTETCKAVAVQPIPIFPIEPPGNPPPPAPPAPPPILGQPDIYGDEITYDLCSQMQANANAIVHAINQLQQQQGDGSNGIDACCAAVVSAISGITQTLTLIFNQLATSLGTGGATLDLTPIVTELTCLCDSLKTLAAAPPTDIAPITAALGRIGAAIASAPGTDVSQIVAQLKTIADQGDVDQAIIDALAQQGLITPADQQVLQGIKWSDAIAYALSSSPVRAVWKFIKQIGGDADTVAFSIANFAAPGINFAETIVGDTLKIQRNLLWSLITPLLDQSKSAVKPAGPVSLGNISVDPDRALSDVAAVMLSIKEMALLVGLFREGAGEQLSKLGEKILAIIGLEEIREVQLGPLVRHGMARVAEMQAKSIFRQEMPGASALASLVARGLLDPLYLPTMFAANGVPDILVDATTKDAYRGFNARQMLRLIETNLFNQADIADELTFAGMRTVSQHRMLLAAPYLATASQRSQLIAAYEAAAVEGLLADADLANLVDSAENNSDRDDLILRRVKQMQVTAATKELIPEYASLFKVGIWTDAAYRANLAALGLQQWKIDLEAGKAEAAANVATFKKNLAEAAALEHATVAEERKAAMAGFKSGALNSNSLASALLLTGLSPTQTAAWVSLADLQRAGSLRWIFGLLKPPPEAALLKARVSALADQRKRLQIDDPTFVGALQALNIPDRYINALRAATDALITPKTAAVTIPVQTS